MGEWVRGGEALVVAQPSILLWRKIDDITLYFSSSGKVFSSVRSLDSPLFVHEEDFMKTKENKNYINHNFVRALPNSSFISFCHITLTPLTRRTFCTTEQNLFIPHLDIHEIYSCSEDPGCRN
jgi:hypothetical protein